MEVLRGVRGLRDLDVVLRRKLDKSLNPRTRMFRTLSFIAMREQHHHAGKEVPLGFSGADELVDDGLRHVDEVSELSFPEDKRLGIVTAVSVFEAENSSLRKRRVVDLATGLIGGDVFERHVFVFVLD